MSDDGNAYDPLFDAESEDEILQEVLGSGTAEEDIACDDELLENEFRAATEGFEDDDENENENEDENGQLHRFRGVLEAYKARGMNDRSSEDESEDEGQWPKEDPYSVPYPTKTSKAPAGAKRKFADRGSSPDQEDSDGETSVLFRNKKKTTEYTNSEWADRVKAAAAKLQPPAPVAAHPSPPSPPKEEAAPAATEDTAVHVGGLVGLLASIEKAPAPATARQKAGPVEKL